MTDYPDSACDAHRNVKTNEPVCIICMGDEIESLHAENAALQAKLDEVEADRRALVRELDVIWNGVAGAARQASLCDVVAQIREELPALRAVSEGGAA